MGCRQAVRHRTLTPASVGPNPAIPARKKHLRRQVLFSGWDAKASPGICACRKCVGSHSPPADLQARLQGAGRANLRQRRRSGKLLPFLPFRNFIDPFSPFSVLCPDSDLRKGDFRAEAPSVPFCTLDGSVSN